MNIPISTAKILCEELHAAAAVILTHDGLEEHVATWGKHPYLADAAAAMGNKLKATLGWPEYLCQATPLSRICRNCRFWGSAHPDLNSCSHPSVGAEKPDGIYEEGMTYYHEGIRTGPNFGCIHFDPK